MSVEDRVADLYGIDPSRVRDQTSSARTEAQQQTQTAREESSGYSEADLTADVIHWADLMGAPYSRLLHIHSEAAGKTRAPGQRAGTPDLFLPVPRGDYAGLWLELKRPGNDLQPSQHKVLRRLHRAGYAVEVAWTHAQAVYVLRCYVETPEELISGW